MRLTLRNPAALLLAVPALAQAHAGDHSGMMSRLMEHLTRSPDHLIGLAIVFGIAVVAVRAVHARRQRAQARQDRH